MNRRVFLLLLSCTLGTLGWTSCTSDTPEVVVYTALDSVFSRELFAEFEKETGIRVRAVFDTEATKTAGLVDRLRREKSAPRCDVFWNNEIARTIQLAREDVFVEYRSPNAKDIPDRYRAKDGTWTGFAARARVAAYDPKRLGDLPVPQTLDALLDPSLRGQVAIANPAFGTTGTHLAALLHLRGEENYRAFLGALRDNDVRVVAGNSSSRDRVLSGEVLFGLTDTDDVEVVRRRGESIDETFFAGEGTLVIPNTIGVVRGGPNPDPAMRFVDWVLDPSTELRLANGPSRQIPVRASEASAEKSDGVLRLADVRELAVDWDGVADSLPLALEIAREILGSSSR